MSDYSIMSRRNQIKRNKPSKPSHFIGKLYQMMEDCQSEPVISWTQGGDGINIKNVSRFSEEVLPVYFSHNNYSSFIRQLNMYKFRKVRHSEGQNVYMNEHFRSGCYHQLKNICRKIKQQRDHLQMCKEIKQKKSLNRELNDLQGRQKNLESLCRHYIIQNQKIMKQNQNLIKKMENDSLEKEKKLEKCIVMLLANSFKELSFEDQSPLSIKNGSQGLGNSHQVSPLEALSQRLGQNEMFQHVKHMFENIFSHRKEERFQICSDYARMSPLRSFSADQPMILKEEINDDAFLSIEQFQDVQSIPIKLQDSA